MTFKEMVEEDINVFLNLEEFAEKLQVNNIEVVGILSDDKFIPSKYDQYGTFIENKVLILSKKDWEKLGSPSFGYTLNFNECSYKIKGLSDKVGVIELKLEGNRT